MFIYTSVVMWLTLILIWTIHTWLRLARRASCSAWWSLARSCNARNRATSFSFSLRILSCSASYSASRSYRWNKTNIDEVLFHVKNYFIGCLVLIERITCIRRKKTDNKTALTPTDPTKYFQQKISNKKISSETNKHVTAFFFMYSTTFCSASFSCSARISFCLWCSWLIASISTCIFCCSSRFLSRSLMKRNVNKLSYSSFLSDFDNWINW